MFNPNWPEITKSLVNFSQILINLGLFLLYWASFQLVLLLGSYLWKLAFWINQIIWANLKAPFAKKSAIPAPSEPKKPTQPTPQLNPHDPEKK